MVEMHFAEIGSEIVPQGMAKRIPEYQHFPLIEGIGVFGDEIPFFDISARDLLHRNIDFVIRLPNRRRAGRCAGPQIELCKFVFGSIRRCVLRERPRFRSFELKPVEDRFHSAVSAGIIPMRVLREVERIRQFAAILGQSLLQIQIIDFRLG